MPPLNGKQLMGRMFGQQPQAPQSFDQMAAAAVTPQQKGGLMSTMGDMMQVIAKLRAIMDTPEFQVGIASATQMLSSGIMEEWSRMAVDLPQRLALMESRIERIENVQRSHSELLGSINAGIERIVAASQPGSQSDTGGDGDGYTSVDLSHAEHFEQNLFDAYRNQGTEETTGEG